MLRKIFKSKIILLSTVLLIGSCESFLEEDLNVDPNKPITVPVNAILPSVGINIADIYGGQYSRFNCMLTQQVEGVERQWSSFNQYSGLTPNRFDATWSDLYEAVFVELDALIAQSVENGFGHYEGVGQVLYAYSLMIATDVWGDIPYSEAGQGVEFQNPVYEDQATVIYPEIYRLLGEAITNLNGSDGGRPVGSDDVFYGGDISKWIKAAYAIRARGYLHQGNYTAALSDIRNAFESRDDNMRFTYTDAAQGQWFRFNRDRTGDLEFHPFMEGLMTSLNDTDRLAMFNPTFITDHPYLIAAFGQDLISFREAKFIEAECLSRTGGSATEIRDAYLAGIEASFTEVGLGDAEYMAYIANPAVDPGVGSIDLEDHILIQKYIGLFVQPEVYNDYRRTDIPAITPVSGTQVPVRWNYSSDELLFNENAPSQSEADLFGPKVDWDS